jgi:hypothetical protein
VYNVGCCGAYVMSTWSLHGNWEHTWEQTFPWTCKCMFPWLGTLSVPTWECIIPTYECVSPCENFQVAWKHLMSQLWNNTFPCLWTSNIPICECQDKGMHGEFIIIIALDSIVHMCIPCAHIAFLQCYGKKWGCSMFP